MKRILGIMGSPRSGGNTHTLMRRVEQGVIDGGSQMVIKLLTGLEISECDGCHVCWSGKACSKKDDMNQLFTEIARCDALVFGTPVYWYGPTALMKAFIDRFVYFNCEENRRKIIGKPAAVLVPYEETSPETAAPVVEFFEHSLSYLQMHLVGTVIAPGVTRRGEVKDHKAAYDLGSRLATEVNGK